MLPDGSGFDVCSQIRAMTYTPIIFVTARATDFDELTGIAIGGDDYITKPFNPLEVVARIQAILRRRQHYHTQAEQAIREQPVQQSYAYESFTLNPNEAVLTVGGKQVDCTAKELEPLTFFCKHPNRVFTLAQLYEQVLGDHAHLQAAEKDRGRRPVPLGDPEYSRDRLQICPTGKKVME